MVPTIFPHVHMHEYNRGPKKFNVDQNSPFFIKSKYFLARNNDAFKTRSHVSMFRRFFMSKSYHIWGNLLCIYYHDNGEGVFFNKINPLVKIVTTPGRRRLSTLVGIYYHDIDTWCFSKKKSRVKKLSRLG